jgi:3'-phosphoadenosine 5'-phosphosulfate (PAPS) 3'-phosphatase
VPDDDGPVTDQEQNKLLEALHRHLDAGRLDLEQFDARAARLYCAKSRAEARATLDGLPLLEAPASRARRTRRRRGEGEPVQPHWVATDEVFRDPTSGRVMRVWVDPVDGTRHYAENGP